MIVVPILKIVCKLANCLINECGVIREIQWRKGVNKERIVKMIVPKRFNIRWKSANCLPLLFPVKDAKKAVIHVPISKP